MGKVIEDLMQFEIDIKLAYFGPGKFTPSKIKRQQSLSFSRGLHSGNTSEHSLSKYRITKINHRYKTTMGSRCFEKFCKKV